MLYRVDTRIYNHACQLPGAIELKRMLTLAKKL